MWHPTQRNPASRPRDFMRLPHDGHRGFATLCGTSKSSMTPSFSRLRTRGRSRTEATTRTRSPGISARTTSRNLFEGSYAMTSRSAIRNTTWPPSKVRGAELTFPEKEPAVHGVFVDVGST